MNLRRAEPGDSVALLAWRNDPATRLMSFDQGEVATEDHEAWFAAKLADPRTEIWIGTVDARPVGQVRFDLLEEGVAVVSIAVGPSARGKGHGRGLLLAGIEAQGLRAQTLRAHVRTENEASLKLFRGCGFVETSRNAGDVALERPADEPAGAPRR